MQCMCILMGATPGLLRSCTVPWQSGSSCTQSTCPPPCQQLPHHSQSSEPKQQLSRSFPGLNIGCDNPVLPEFLKAHERAFCHASLHATGPKIRSLIKLQIKGRGPMLQSLMPLTPLVLNGCTEGPQRLNMTHAPFLICLVKLVHFGLKLSNFEFLSLNMSPLLRCRCCSQSPSTCWHSGMHGTRQSPPLPLLDRDCPAVKQT